LIEGVENEASPIVHSPGHSAFGEAIALCLCMKITNLLFGLSGVLVGVLLAPKTGIWNRYFARLTREGQKAVGCQIKRAQKTVKETADSIVNTLETGRQAITS
jgi:hypothetical protein